MIKITPTIHGKRIEVDHPMRIDASKMSLEDEKKVDEFLALMRSDAVAEPFTEYCSELISIAYDHGVLLGSRIGLVVGSFLATIVAICVSIF